MNDRGKAHCRGWVALVVLAVILCAGEGRAADKAPGRSTVSSTPAQDFPPGAWTDNVERHISDYKGKVLIIFSFDPTYLDAPTDVKKKLALFDIFRDKPVAFLGVVTGRRDINASAPMLRTLEVNYPMYYDNLGQMSSRFMSYSINLHMVDAEGNISYMSVTPSEVDDALKDVKWKYKDNGYDKKLDGVVNLLEWNHYDAALKQLKPMRKSSNKELAAGAEKLYQDVHAEGEKWKAEADAEVSSEPVMAYDLYGKIVTAFAGEDLAKGAQEGIKSLKSTKPVMDELAAREMFGKLNTAIPRAKYEQRIDIADFCQNIAKKYPETPTGKRAKALYAELMGQR